MFDAVLQPLASGGSAKANFSGAVHYVVSVCSPLVDFWLLLTEIPLLDKKKV
jgi:hypothetical protein